MDVNFIAQPQPDSQLGPLIENALAAPAPPSHVTIVSAFTSLQTILRFKRRLRELHEAGTHVRVVVGVDMGGTSKEVLKELESWPVEVYIFKNRKSGVTFHPKLYMVRNASRAELFLGSNNLTDGGLFKNYEGATHIVYGLPADQGEFNKATNQLAKFLDPQPPVGQVLDAPYLTKLLARKDIPSEAESRARKRVARIEGKPLPGDDDVFGYEPTPGPPKLPVEVNEVVVAAVKSQLDDLKKKKAAATRAAKKTAKGKAPAKKTTPEAHYLLSSIPIAQISPDAFYMELVKTKGVKGFPGEQRIPLEAINAARDFWGWPYNYTKSVNPRKGKTEGKNGKDRIYWNCRPMWRLTQEGSPGREEEIETRMYFSEANSDFRITSGSLKKWGAAGDIVRIIRSDRPGIDYECSLAKKDTPLHAEWAALCSSESRQSGRRFGFS